MLECAAATSAVLATIFTFFKPEAISVCEISATAAESRGPSITPGAREGRLFTAITSPPRCANASMHLYVASGSRSTFGITSTG